MHTLRIRNQNLVKGQILTAVNVVVRIRVQCSAVFLRSKGSTIQVLKLSHIQQTDQKYYHTPHPPKSKLIFSNGIQQLWLFRHVLVHFSFSFFLSLNPESVKVSIKTMKIKIILFDLVVNSPIVLPSFSTLRG